MLKWSFRASPKSVLASKARSYWLSLTITMHARSQFGGRSDFARMIFCAGGLWDSPVRQCSGEWRRKNECIMCKCTMNLFCKCVIVFDFVVYVLLLLVVVLGVCFFFVCFFCAFFLLLFFLGGGGGPCFFLFLLLLLFFSSSFFVVVVVFVTHQLGEGMCIYVWEYISSVTV